VSTERIVAAVVGGLLLIAAWQAARAGRRRGEPAVDVLPIFLGTWGAGLTLFAVPLIEYGPTPLRAWVALYGAVLAGVAGCLLAQRTVPGPALEPDAAQQALRTSFNLRRLRMVWLGSAVLGMIGFAAFLYAVSKALPVASVITDPASVKAAKSEGGGVVDTTYGPWRLLTYFNIIAFALWSVTLRVRGFTGAWWIGRFAGVLSAVPFLLSADRVLLVTMLLWTAAIQVLWPGRVRGRRLLVTAAIAVSVAAVGLTVVGNRYGGSIGGHPEITPYLKDQRLDTLTIPYLYLTANIPTFGQLTEDPQAPLTYGQMSLLPVVKAADVALPVGVPPEQTGIFYPIPFTSFSNYGWLGSFWLDGRLIGCLLLPMLVLWIAAVARRRLARRPSVATLLFAAAMLHAVVLALSANAFTNTTTWQLILLCPAIALVVDEKAGAALRDRLRGRRHATRWVAVATLAVVILAAAALRTRSDTATTVTGRDVQAQLRAIEKVAATAHEQLGSYPDTTALVSRFRVAEPALQFRALPPSEALAEPAPGTIVVYSEGFAARMRARASDGRVYELSLLNGQTVGPATRDG
jgi:hypothetical protein